MQECKKHIHAWPTSYVCVDAKQARDDTPCMSHAHGWVCAPTTHVADLELQWPCAASIILGDGLHHFFDASKMSPLTPPHWSRETAPSTAPTAMGLTSGRDEALTTLAAPTCMRMLVLHQRRFPSTYSHEGYPFKVGARRGRASLLTLVLHETRKRRPWLGR
jgi:hypothetical protein